MEQKRISIGEVQMVSQAVRREARINAWFAIAFIVAPVLLVAGVMALDPEVLYKNPVMWFGPAFVMLLASGALWYRYWRVVSSKEALVISGAIDEKRVAYSIEPLEELEEFSFEIDREKGLVTQTGKVGSRDGSVSRSNRVVSRLDAPDRIFWRALYQFRISGEYYNVTPLVYFHYEEGDDFSGYFYENRFLIIDSKGLTRRTSFGLVSYSGGE